MLRKYRFVFLHPTCVRQDFISCRDKVQKTRHTYVWNKKWEWRVQRRCGKQFGVNKFVVTGNCYNLDLVSRFNRLILFFFLHLYRASWYYQSLLFTNECTSDCLKNNIKICFGARGSAVGWGTALQAGRSQVRFPMVPLEFFIDIILPAALWSWGWLSL